MDFFIDHAHLAAVAAALPKRGTGTIPPLVQLDARGDALTVTASSDATGEAVTLRRPADVKRPGSVVLDAGQLADALRSVRGTVHVRTTATRLTVECGGSRDSMPLVVDLYPRTPALPDEGGMAFDAPALAAALGRVAGYCEASAVSPLAGVHVEPHPSDETRAVFAATDRHRLSVAYAQADGPVVVARRTLIPREVADALRRTLAKRSGPVTLWVASGVIGLRVGDDVATWPALDAEFPDWRAVVPGDRRLVVRGDARLREAMQRHAARANASQGTLWTLTDGELRLDTVADTLASVDVVPCETGDDRRERAFAARYMLAAIETVGDVVSIYGDHAMAPHVVTGADESGGFVVIMPMRSDGVRRGDA